MDDAKIRAASWKAYTDTVKEPGGERQHTPGEMEQIRAHLRTMGVPVIRESRRLLALDHDDPACPVPKEITATYLRWHDAELARRGLPT